MPAPAASSSAAPAIVATLPSGQAFQDGLRDRIGLEHWFTGLTGWTRLGAANWIAVRSTRAAQGACNVAHLQVARPDAAPADMVAWLDGCQRARALLAGADQRRTSEPDYRAGWNSYQPGQ
jgi:hypothetical protein